MANLNLIFYTDTIRQSDQYQTPPALEFKPYSYFFSGTCLFFVTSRWLRFLHSQISLLLRAPRRLALPFAQRLEVYRT